MIYMFVLPEDNTYLIFVSRPNTICTLTDAYSKKVFWLYKAKPDFCCGDSP